MTINTTSPPMNPVVARLPISHEKARWVLATRKVAMPSTMNNSAVSPAMIGNPIQPSNPSVGER